MADTLYATIEEFKAVSDSISAKFDTTIQMVLNAAAEVIDGYCNRRVPFVTGSAAPRLYGGSGKAVQYIDDCTLVTLIEIKENPADALWTALGAGDWLPFTGDARFPNFNQTPYSGVMLMSGGRAVFPSGKFSTMRGFSDDPERDTGRSLPTVRITAKWGYADEVPPQVKTATIAQAHRWLKRGQASWSDTLANSDMGQLQFRKVLDPDIQMMLTNARLVRPAL